MEERDSTGGGCGRGLWIIAALSWFAVVLAGSGFAVDLATAGEGAERGADWIALGIAAALSAIPFATVALAAGRKPGREALVAIFGAIALASGFALLDGAVRLLVPLDEGLAILAHRYTRAAVRAAVLLPYAGLAAIYARGVTGKVRQPIRGWLALARSRGPVGLLSLVLAALLTVSWPLTGALGDSLTSLAMVVEVLSSVIPQLLIFWGVIFVLLTSSGLRTEGAAMLTMLVYAVSALGAGLAGGEGAAVGHVLFVLPLAFLLTELRARGGRILALLPLALGYELGPRLFVDPRDALASGIPELQHILSYVGIALAAVVAGLILWLARRRSAKRWRGKPGGGQLGAWIGAALVALVAWVGWAAIYFTLGNPGFYNDGFLIILEEQADLSQWVGMEGRQERLTGVYQALVETAERDQGPLRSELDELGISYRPYYIINMIRVDGNRRLMGRFEGRSGVDRVILNPNVRAYPRRIPLPMGIGMAATEGQANLAAIQADQAWELGVLGAGVVVGGQDSGYDWAHPALKTQYRGWDGNAADHNYNWHDAWGDSRIPFDDGSHGTHTMGTIVGDDGGANRVGVAPEATWIGCRNMRRGIGNPGSYAECMEFLFAPYPLGGDALRDGDVTRGAHVVNNSWGCPRAEGCYPGTLRRAVRALRAAGVMMVVSAGNDGPACGTASTPPANYDAVFTVGATTNAGDVVGFSSRGPADGLLKPDIAAPGQQVRSSTPDGQYGTAAGTSMAGPHVAGTVALVWSADERLIGQISETEALLCGAAAPRPVNQSCALVEIPEGPLAAAMSSPACTCGAMSGVPNNVYGCGLVNAGAAVEAALGR